MTRTFNWKIVFKTYGALLLIESLFMATPTLVSHLYREYDTMAFGISTGLTLLAGLFCLLLGGKAQKKVGQREGYVIVASVWLVFAAFGMLPFYLSGACSSITDSYFEAMAGFSTFGGSIFNDVEVLTHGILFWRAMMQWLGGMGIIVLSIAVLPMFGLGGMQLYSAEVTGISYEKLGPRISGTAKGMWLMYISLTLIEFGLLYLMKMESFDAICHSMSTIATGGFSTKNAGMGAYGAGVQWVVAFFAMLSAINFTLLIFIFKGKPKRLWKDEETRWYISSTLLLTMIMAFGIFFQCGHQHLENGLSSILERAEEAVRMAFFTVTNTITSTGFSADYPRNEWPEVMTMIIFMMMFLGGCAGSTAGGIKQVRIVMLLKNSIAECKRRIHPNAVIPAKLNGQPVSIQTTNNIAAFVFLYVLISLLTAVAFSATGLDFGDAIGTAVSCMGNLGMNVGRFSSGCYSELTDAAKWIASFVMCIGRLEIFTFILLFSPALWRK